MARPRKYTDEQMIAGLTETKGMVYLAADRIGCAAETIYKRAKTSEKVRNAMKTERGKVVDTAELKLFSAILNSEPWAIQMCLKTLGKDRGYVERTEQNTNLTGDVNLNHASKEPLPSPAAVNAYLDGLAGRPAGTAGSDQPLHANGVSKRLDTPPAAP